MIALFVATDPSPVQAAEPVTVINTERAPDVPPQAQPQIDQSSAALPVGFTASAPAPSFDPNFETTGSEIVPDSAAPSTTADAAASTTAAAAATDPAPAPAHDVAPPAPAAAKNPVVALDAKPQPSPEWEKPGEFFTRPGLTTITRYNRKVTRTVGDETTPIVAAAAKSPADPRYNAIECVAGCNGPKGSVVYYALRLSSQTGHPVEPAGIVKAFETAAAKPVVDVVACVAGCYDSTPKIYIARFPLAKAQAGPGGLYPVSASATTAALVPAAASADDIRRVKSRARLLVKVNRLAVQRQRKPTLWRTAIVRPQFQTAYRGWRTNVRY